MSKTIKDIFLEEQAYVIDINLNKGFTVFVEGLDNIGCGIFDLSYPIEDIENFIVELNFNGEFLKNLSNSKITLNTTVEEIKQLAMEELRKGYKVVSGLDNANELTDNELLEYMRIVLLEHEED